MRKRTVPSIIFPHEAQHGCNVSTLDLESTR
jgi:hypothetical protein